MGGELACSGPVHPRPEAERQVGGSQKARGKHSPRDGDTHEQRGIRRVGLGISESFDEVTEMSLRKSCTLVKSCVRQK